MIADERSRNADERGRHQNRRRARNLPLEPAGPGYAVEQNSLYRFGQEAEVMFASHHWPRWGNERIQEVLRAQRDLYANMNNQVLHLANQGVTINQVHNVYELPKDLQEKWYCRGYHGSPQHNARGVIQRYLGFWDCNPTTLIPLSPEDSAPLYVEMMGGSEKILARGRALHDAGDYLLASEIVNKLVQAEPANADAKDLLADVFARTASSRSSSVPRPARANARRSCPASAARCRR
jgi:alkyl sulfatase BDS1-like metallo-beta-lactamase superfamily hydrolase